MLSLEIFTPQLEPAGWVDRYYSLEWSNRLNNAGELELWAPHDSHNFEVIKEGYILWRHLEDGMIINSIEYGVLEKEGPMIIARGHTLEKLLGLNIVWGLYNQYDYPEQVLLGLANSQAINPSNSLRKIPLINSARFEGTPSDSKITFQNTGGNLLEVMSELATTYGLAFKVVIHPEARELELVVFRPQDKTHDNTQGNLPVIFDSEKEDLGDSNYLKNVEPFRNVALVAGMGEGKDRVYLELDSSSGLQRRELFVDARDLNNQKENSEETLTQEEYLAILKTRGESKLAEHPPVEEYSTLIRVEDNPLYEFGVDYNLGDKVTIVDQRLGLTINIDPQVVRWVYSATTEEQLELEFGEPQPTLLERR